MRNQFDRQLNTLNGELIQMGHMVEQAIEHAIEAMVHQDAEKARQNMEFDSEVDQQEKDIRDTVYETSDETAAGSQRSSPDFCSIKDDYRYGTNW